MAKFDYTQPFDRQVAMVNMLCNISSVALTWRAEPVHARSVESATRFFNAVIKWQPILVEILANMVEQDDRLDHVRKFMDRLKEESDALAAQDARREGGDGREPEA